MVKAAYLGRAMTGVGGTEFVDLTLTIVRCRHMTGRCVLALRQTDLKLKCWPTHTVMALGALMMFLARLALIQRWLWRTFLVVQRFKAALFLKTVRADRTKVRAPRG